MSDTDTMFRVVNGRASKEEAESYIAGLITRLAEAEKWRDRWQRAVVDAEATQTETESQLRSLTEENERPYEALVDAERRVLALEEAIYEALKELGVPDRSYPAPVANAVEILNQALSPIDPPLAQEEGRDEG